MTLLRTAAALATLRARPRRLLAVLAHPDDEAYGCAGALRRAARAPDAAAVLLCLTRGEAAAEGRRRGLDPEALGRLREARLVAVATRLGLDGLVVPGLPDGRLARLPLEEVAAVVREVIDAYAPTVVVAHDPRGVNGHADHVATHWALRRALRPGEARLAMVAYPPAVVEGARPRLLFPTPDEEIDVVLRLDEDATDAKEESLRIHEAHVTLRPEHATSGRLLLRDAVERYDLLGEAFDPPLHDLFDALAVPAPGDGLDHRPGPG